MLLFCGYTKYRFWALYVADVSFTFDYFSAFLATMLVVPCCLFSVSVRVMIVVLNTNTNTNPSCALDTCNGLDN
jgi:hypothetical protein